MNLFTKQIQTHRLRRGSYGCQEGRMAGRASEGVWTDVHTLIFKMDNHKALLYRTGNAARCHVAAWMGGEIGGEWIHVYVWLSPFAITCC